MHALVLDPGGVLKTSLVALSGLLPSRPAQRRRLSLPKLRIGYPNNHNYTYFGAQYTACILALSSFVPPLLGLHVDIPTSLLALGFHSESLTLAGWDFHPPGNNAKFFGLTPNPNGSDLFSARGTICYMCFGFHHL